MKRIKKKIAITIISLNIRILRMVVLRECVPNDIRTRDLILYRPAPPAHTWPRRAHPRQRGILSGRVPPALPVRLHQVALPLVPGDSLNVAVSHGQIRAAGKERVREAVRPRSMICLLQLGFPFLLFPTLGNHLVTYPREDFITIYGVKGPGAPGTGTIMVCRS